MTREEEIRKGMEKYGELTADLDRELHRSATVSIIIIFIGLGVMVAGHKWIGLAVMVLGLLLATLNSASNKAKKLQVEKVEDMDEFYADLGSDRTQIFPFFDLYVMPDFLLKKSKALFIYKWDELHYYEVEELEAGHKILSVVNMNDMRYNLAECHDQDGKEADLLQAADLIAQHVRTKAQYLKTTIYSANAGEAEDLSVDGDDEILDDSPIGSFTAEDYAEADAAEAAADEDANELVVEPAVGGTAGGAFNFDTTVDPTQAASDPMEAAARAKAEEEAEGPAEA